MTKVGTKQQITEFTTVLRRGYFADLQAAMSFIQMADDDRNGWVHTDAAVRKMHTAAEEHFKPRAPEGAARE